MAVTGSTSALPVSQEVATYLAAVDALAAAVDLLPDEFAPGDVAALQVAEARIASVRLARLDAVDRSGVWRDNGCKALWSWLRQITRMSEADAKAADRLRRQLSGLPLVADALAGGRVSKEHARVLGSSLATLSRYTLGTAWHTPQWLARMEAAFLSAAEITDPGVLKVELSKRLRALAPEPAAKDDAERRAKRRGSIRPGYDEMWDLEALLDPDGGQVMAAAVAAWRRGDHTEGDERSQAQRTADALVGIAQHYLDADLGVNVRNASPHLVILVPEARMAAWQTRTDPILGQPLSCCERAAQDGALPCTHPPGDSWRPPDPRTEALFTGHDGLLAPAGAPPDYECQLHGLDQAPPAPDRLLDHAQCCDPVPAATYQDGRPVPDSAFARYLCSADLTRLVLDADSEPLDVGRTKRLHTHAMWLAACQRWHQQCAVTSCGAPTAHLEMHHPTWWSNGGPTSLDNSLPLCTRHHHQVHEGHVLTLRNTQRIGPHGYLAPTGTTTQVASTPTAIADPADQPKPAPKQQQRRQPRTGTLRGDRIALDRIALDRLRLDCPASAAPGRDHYGPVVNGVATCIDGRARARVRRR